MTEADWFNLASLPVSLFALGMSIRDWLKLRRLK